jgi:hypothetical protein
MAKGAGFGVRVVPQMASHQMRTQGSEGISLVSILPSFGQEVGAGQHVAREWFGAQDNIGIQLADLSPLDSRPPPCFVQSLVAPGYGPPSGGPGAGASSNASRPA